MKKFSDYLQTIARINLLGNGLKIHWVFFCGMLFLSREKWWGDFKCRSTPHEGVDIGCYKIGHEKKIHRLTPQTKIPAMDNGRLITICDDFLGKTLVVEHENQTDPKFRTVCTYAHVIPEPGIVKGRPIKKDQVIATVCSTDKNPQLSSHLHFSCFEIINPMDENLLNWNLFTDPQKVSMIHPFFL